MREDIICDCCGKSDWTHESIGEQIWLTCLCGYEKQI